MPSLSRLSQTEAKIWHMRSKMGVRCTVSDLRACSSQKSYKFTNHFTITTIKCTITWILGSGTPEPRSSSCTDFWRKFAQEAASSWWGCWAIWYQRVLAIGDKKQSAHSVTWRGNNSNERTWMRVPGTPVPDTPDRGIVLAKFPTTDADHSAVFEAI